MKPISILRGTALLLSGCLLLPNPAFAFRIPEAVESTGLEELSRAFQGPTEFAPETPSPRGGLEAVSDRLGFRAWMATLGQWGPTTKALERFDPPTRNKIRGQINQLIKQLITCPGSGALFLDIFGWGLPAAITTLPLDYLSAVLRSATESAQQGFYPHGIFYQPVLSELAGLTPQEFESALGSYSRLVMRLGQVPRFYWERLGYDKMYRLIHEAVRLDREGVPFHVEVIPEEGYTTTWHDVTWSYTAPTPIEREQYVMTVPQSVRLIPDRDRAGLEVMDAQQTDAVLTPFGRGQMLAGRLGRFGVVVWEGLVRADDPSVVADEGRMAALSDDRPEEMSLTLEVPMDSATGLAPWAEGSERPTVWVHATLRDAIPPGWGLQVKELPVELEDASPVLSGMKPTDLVLLDRRYYSPETHLAWKATLANLGRQGLWVREQDLSTLDQDEFAVTLKVLRNSGEALPAVGVEQEIEGTQHRFLYT